MRKSGFYFIREIYCTVEIAYWDEKHFKWISLLGEFHHEGVQFEETMKYRISEMDDINPLTITTEEYHNYYETYKHIYRNAKWYDFEFKM